MTKKPTTCPSSCVRTFCIRAKIDRCLRSRLASGWIVPGAGKCQNLHQAGAVNSTSRSPDGQKLVVLRDAASYITALPAKDAALPEWQAAIEALMLVVELDGPTMMARIGVMRALNRHHVEEFKPKARHWGRRKLKRDQP
jgi:hypothetical protein